MTVTNMQSLTYMIFYKFPDETFCAFYTYLYDDLQEKGRQNFALHLVCEYYTVAYLIMQSEQKWF